jgi:DUF1016 N-terminal domain
MKNANQRSTPSQALENDETIRTGIVDILRTARQMAARYINRLMAAADGEIGKRIVPCEQRGEARASYGNQLIEQLAIDLSKQFGRGYGTTNPKRMFYPAWPEQKMRQTVSVESSKAITFRDLGPVSSSIASRTLSELSAALVCVCSPDHGEKRRKREPSTSLKPSLPDGLFGNSIAKSKANFTNERLCPAIRRPCSKKPPMPNGGMQ